MRFVYVNALVLPTKKAFGYAVIKMCEAFATTQNVILVVPGKTPAVAETIYDFYKVDRKFEIKCLSYLGDKNTKSIIGMRLIFLIKKISFYWALLLHLKLEPGDIVYTRDLVSLVILRLKTRRVFLELHYLSRLELFLYRLIFLASKIIVITPFLKKQLVALGYAEQKILVVPDAADLRDFSAVTKTPEQLRLQLGLPLDRKVILYTGNLFGWKGVYNLALAATTLRPNLVVFVGGSDDELVNFRNFVKVHCLENVMILGYVPHEQIPNYLKAADVLVLPNSSKKDISKFNTSPLKLFEYMASCVPIVASNLPSIRQILNHNNAILVSSDDVTSLAEGIKLVLQNKQASLGLANQALKDVTEYTWDKRAEKILSFL